MSDNWDVNWAVTVDGKDVSSRMRPYLLEIEVRDVEGVVSDHCSLRLDDREGQLKFPPKNSLVDVSLNGVIAFRGRTDSVKSSGTRGGGRILSIDAKSFDTRGAAKTEQLFHKDDATLEAFLGEAAVNAGLTVKVDPQLASVFRDYWCAYGESFMELGNRLAREFGATFKIRDNIAVFVPRGADLGLMPVAAVVGQGGNVINWDIEPFVGWPVSKSVKARWFDRKSATFKEKEVALEMGEEATAERTIHTLAADEGSAQTLATGRKVDAEQDLGGGAVEMDLVPHARAEARLTLSGARPGVDGTYRITSVTHRANRSGGSTTRCEIKRPSEGAGTDERRTG